MKEKAKKKLTKKAESVLITVGIILIIIGFVFLTLIININSMTKKRAKMEIEIRHEINVELVKNGLAEWIVDDDGIVTHMYKHIERE